MVKTLQVLPARTKKELLWWFFITVILVVGVISGLTYRSFTMKLLIKSLEQQKSIIQKTVEELRTKNNFSLDQTLPVSYENRCKKLRKIHKNIVADLEVLEAFIPAAVRLKSFMYDYQRPLIIKGQSTTQNNLTLFIVQLRNYYKNLYVEDFYHAQDPAQSYTTFSLIIP